MLARSRPTQTPDTPAEKRATRLADQLTLLAFALVLLWSVEGLDQYVFGGRLDGLGIRPRIAEGLIGVVLAPFLHGDFAHLGANTVPLFLLGWLVLLRGHADFWIVTTVATLLGGSGVWAFGREGTLHVGASGLVFGYLGFLLVRAVLERSLVSVLLAMTASFLYGGLLWSLFQQAEGISWEGHVSGFLAGAIAARGLTSKGGAA